MYTLGRWILVLSVVVGAPALAWGQSPEESVGQLFQRGMVQYAREDFPSAIRTLESAVRKDPKNIKTLFFLAYAYYKNGDLEDAAATFEEAYRLRNDYSPLPKPQPPQ